MAFIKQGEAIAISPSAIQPVESVMSDPEILERFKKVASDLKIIAPKANDFLYFYAVMMHAAEAVLLDNNGQIKKDAAGNELTAEWEINGDSWKWKCSDSNIKPLKNSNRDIFPESELIKAHKKWIGKPLCLDHQSNSVDMVRGLIVDTYYDFAGKRVVALCALDKITYPDLAHKVSTGVSRAVSMGTGVGRAICFDCGRVATAEAEFCKHMLNKSCYGEINVDLNPIELSIVVNGADPDAQIRHIVAAADSIAEYIKVRDDEDINVDAVSDIVIKLEGALEQVKGLQKAASTSEEDSANEDLDKVSNVVNSINEKLNKLQNDVNKLSQNKQEESIMTTKKEAYFQGGGGPNEPTPGATRYPIDPTADTLRNHVDKQMVGQTNLGPVEDMVPEDKPVKKELQRLSKEQEEKILRREAAVEAAKEALKNKEAYFQGGGGPNEPSAAGQPTYKKEDSDKIRGKEDKQMVGEKPFPGVGDVEGLYGDDLKRKKMLARARLTAKFIKAADSSGSDDLANSRWQVYADNKLILSGTAKEAAESFGIKNEKVESFCELVATEKFGRKIIDTIRTAGFEKAKKMFKGAQPMPAVPEIPAAAPKAPVVPEVPVEMEEEVVAEEYEGRTGDPKEWLPELLEDLGNMFADLNKGVEALVGEPEGLESFRELAEEGAIASSVINMQQKLSKAILIGMKKNASELNEHIEELQIAKHVCDNTDQLNKEQAGQIPVLVQNAADDAKATMAESYKLMEAFVKYAKGTEKIMKKAQAVVETSKGRGIAEPGGRGLEDEIITSEPKDVLADFGDDFGPDPSEADIFGYETVTPESLEELERQLDGLEVAPGSERGPGGRAATLYDPGEEVIIPEGDVITAAEDGGEVADVDVTSKTPTGEVTATGLTEDQAAKIMNASNEPDLTTKEGRAAYREALEKKAQTGIKFNPILDTAHPGGGVTTKMDIKPSGDLGKVETLEEEHGKMMDIAQAPPRVRKMAEEIQNMVSQGRIDPEKDFDKLIANGLDPEAKKYWQQYFGQGDGESKQFATELTKEHAAQKQASEQEAFEAKIARAYELSYDMVRRGMLNDTRPAVKEQVKELMSFNDEAFNSMKRWVERQEVIKTASIPQVGIMNTGESIAVPAPAFQSGLSDLDLLWAGKKV